MKTIPRASALVGGLSLAFSLAANTLAQPTNDLPKLLPPYAELPPTFWEQHGLTLLLGSVAGLLVVGLAVWLILRPRPAPVLPPVVQARRALEALRSQEEDGTWLSRVSGVLRRYITAAFDLPVGEMTTRELIIAMESSQRLNNDLHQAIAEFLQRCDATKFAPGSSAQLQDAIGRALALIEQSEIRRVQLAGGKSTNDA